MGEGTCIEFLMKQVRVANGEADSRNSEVNDIYYMQKTGQYAY